MSFSSSFTPSFQSRHCKRGPLTSFSVNQAEATCVLEASESVVNGLTNAFDTLADSIVNCLIQSDRKRDSGIDGASTGWTGWVDDASALRLQQCFDAVHVDASNEDYQRWVQWIKSCPASAIIDASNELRSAVSAAVTRFYSGGSRASLDDTTIMHEEEPSFVSRIAMRLIALPSGKSLVQNLQTPGGAMVYGKLLYGGVTRYRLVGSGTKQRRAGERRTVANSNDLESLPSWLQYGGPDRNYQAVDMGSCLLMEITILPKGLRIPSKNLNAAPDLFVQSIPWNPQKVFCFKNDEGKECQSITALTENSLNVCDLETQFCTSVGGLRPQIEEIVRRVLDGRVVRPASGGQASSAIDKIRREEMEGLLELGLQPVRGLLLEGPPGCGKTALAREISSILDARPPKILAAPELLDRWVGGTEKLVRELFADAEAELKACNGDPTKSALHVVVIDEIDAVFRKRSSAAIEGSSEVTRASAVNQILAKLDGVNALENVLLVGMTNRKELLDPALLRPGRLEVHVKIPLPDREGRREILRIHFGALRQRGRLSKPLCDAIDGVKANMGRMNQFSLNLRLVPNRKHLFVYPPSRKIRDLASDRWTGGFSGADIAGLVRSAGSFALARARSQGEGLGLDGLFITLEDVYAALQEVKR